jgi:DNA replication and repair protein RecF
MRLTKVLLKNFRNYEQAEVNTDSSLVLILGENAAGKTNFLESRYYLSHLKSFRAPDISLVRRGADFFAIDGQVGEHHHEVVMQVFPKTVRQCKTDGIKIKRSLWQTVRTVLFVPNDLNLFILGPIFRRKFLDETLSQKSPAYGVHLTSLEHVLKQRGALLQLLSKGEGNREELEFWNLELARVSIAIRQDRQAFVEYLNKNLKATVGKLTGFEYDCVIEFSTFSGIANEAEFLIELNRLAEAEIRSSKNLLGPHRDDFIINKDGELNIHNSSRGELRAQILALKLLQAEYLSDENQKPIILLDDVFSELDETRRTKLIENLSGHQIFITSTEEHHLPKLNKDTLVLNVAGNTIK